MKLVDKMILLTRMLKDNSKYTLDVESTLQTQQSYFQDQQRFFQDKHKHEELIDIVQEMRDLKVKHDEVWKSINHNTQQLLRAEEVNILQRDYSTFDSVKIDTQLMNERMDHLDPTFIKILKNEIGFYSDWRWAGLELNPTNGYLTRAFLACDPLYLYRGNVIDKDQVANNFNRFFSERRLMQYDRIEHLPQQHIGIAVSVNCYDYWPMEPIKREMQAVHNVLKAGGHYIFTYNDCEHVASLDFCANNFRAYNTKTLITHMAEMLGFEVVKEANVCNGAHSYMICKKHGNLTSDKLSAPLVAIESPLDERRRNKQK